VAQKEIGIQEGEAGRLASRAVDDLVCDGLLEGVRLFGNGGRWSLGSIAKNTGGPLNNGEPVTGRSQAPAPPDARGRHQHGDGAIVAGEHARPTGPLDLVDEVGQCRHAVDIKGELLARHN